MAEMSTMETGVKALSIWMNDTLNLESQYENQEAGTAGSSSTSLNALDTIATEAGSPAW